MHYIQLNLVQTSPMLRYQHNHPVKKLKYSIEPAQMICEISLTVHQSADNIKKINQLWYLTWAIKLIQNLDKILDCNHW